MKSDSDENSAGEAIEIVEVWVNYYNNYYHINYELHAQLNMQIKTSSASSSEDEQFFPQITKRHLCIATIAIYKVIELVAIAIACMI